jgi:hypothetical protein
MWEEVHDQLLWHVDLIKELIGILDRAQFIVFASEHQVRTFHLSPIEAESLGEAIKFGFIFIACHIHEAQFSCFGYDLQRVCHTFSHTAYPDKRCGADVKTYGSYLTTRNHRSVLVGDSNTLVLSSSICSLTSGSKNRRPSPKRTGTMPMWISSTSPARRHC